MSPVPAVDPLVVRFGVDSLSFEGNSHDLPLHGLLVYHDCYYQPRRDEGLS